MFLVCWAWLKEGRVKVVRVFALTVFFMDFRGLSAATFHVREGQEATLGNLNSAFRKLMV